MDDKKDKKRVIELPNPKKVEAQMHKKNPEVSMFVPEFYEALKAVMEDEGDSLVWSN